MCKWRVGALCMQPLPHFYNIHFEIIDDPRNPIDSQQCVLFTNNTIFCSKSHHFVLNGTIFIL